MSTGLVPTAATNPIEPSATARSPIFWMDNAQHIGPERPFLWLRWCLGLIREWCVAFGDIRPHTDDIVDKGEKGSGELIAGRTL